MKPSAFTFKRLAILLIFASLLPLTACGPAGRTEPSIKTVGELNQEVWIYEWGYWKVVNIWIFNANEWRLIGNKMDIVVFLKTYQAEGRGVIVKLQKQDSPDGNVIYIIELAGRGMDELNWQAFNGTAVFNQQNGQLHLMLPSQPLDDLRSYQLTIHGGNILSANTTSYANDMVQWVNPDSVDVRMTGRFHAGELVPIILAVNPNLRTTIPAGVIAALGLLALILAIRVIHNKGRRKSLKQQSA